MRDDLEPLLFTQDKPYLRPPQRPHIRLSDVFLVS